MSRSSGLVVGFLNPLITYPSPLVALLATGDGYEFRYPNGTVSPVTVTGALDKWAKDFKITLLEENFSVFPRRNSLTP